MPDQELPPSIFLMLERNVGKRIRVIVEPSYGFEGTLLAAAQELSAIWLSEAEAIVLRSTLAQPIPQIANREERGDIYLNLKGIQRIEVLPAAPSRSSR
ncbi:MAG: hypothetical protein ACM3UY_00865 [Methanocella sp.]|jgi:hypothetical protein